jgi:Kef-type K+ transport system membrane component KefB
LDDLFIFLLILVTGLFFSELFRKLHLPYVLALIFAGIVIGPVGLNLVELTPSILLLGSLGAIFVMFMAGLEIKTEYLRENWKKVVLSASINGGVPGVAGFAISQVFGYELITSLIVGVIFISSSVAIILPTLQEKELIGTNFGSILIGSIVIQDVVSLIFLSIILQSTDPTTALPLPLFIVVVISSVFLELEKELKKMFNSFLFHLLP